MRIERFAREREGDRTRVSARITWEDRDRAPLELFYDVEGPAAEAAEPDPNAFLLACAHAASFQGEKRITVDGPICPVLRDGLVAASQLIALWHGPRRPAAIEPSGGFRPPRPVPAREGVFLSGGIDSLELCFHNRESFPADHPAAFRDAVHVFGLPYTGPEASPTYRNFFARSRASASAAARAFGLPLTFVRTNLADLERDPGFYAREQFGIAFASIAHLFSCRFTVFSFASQLEIHNGLEPLGSHPFLDPFYRTAALEFRTPGSERTRLDKVRRVAASPELLASLMTCHEAPLEDDRFNCGKCEKCLRTMAELWIAGVLDAAPYPPNGLTPSAIDGVDLQVDGELFWRPLPAEFRALGREDLARAVDGLLARLRKHQRWAEDRGWKGALRRLDRRVFGSRLMRVYRRARGRRRAPADPISRSSS